MSIYDEVPELEPEVEEEKKELNPKVVTIVAVMILLIIGGSIYFGIKKYEANEADKVLTVNKVKEYVDPDEMLYDSYVDYLKDHDSKEVEKAFVYNMKLPEKERKEVDPYSDDMYIGFDQNRNESVSLFSVEDGYVLITHDTKTKEVYYLTEWNQLEKKTLEILKLRGQKTELSKKAIYESNESKKSEYVRDIQKINDKLLALYAEETADV